VADANLQGGKRGRGADPSRAAGGSAEPEPARNGHVETAPTDAGAGENDDVVNASTASPGEQDAGGNEEPPAEPHRESAPLSEEDEAWASDRGAPSINLAFLATAHHLVTRPPIADGFEALRRLVREPAVGAEPMARLAVELGRIATGRSTLRPPREDRRYADPAWQSNPILRGLAQTHTAITQAADDLIEKAVDDEGARYRLSLAVKNYFEAVAPPNIPFLNPAAVKAGIDSGGRSVVRGAGWFVQDMRRPPRLPVRTEATDFRLGVDIAATPGAVIARTKLFELIQYQPVTPTVREQPLLIVPSVVNKYYLTDLSPGRSLAAHALQAGYQTFSLSWVNADVEHRDFGLDDYIAAVEEALDIVEEVSGNPHPHMLGVCAGGLFATVTAAHLAAVGKSDRIGSLTLLVCILDQESEAMPGGLLSRGTGRIALDAIKSRGYVDGRDLTASLAWLRAVDSIWWPWTHRYLIGGEMPKFDLFYWSEDVANVPAALVADSDALASENRLARPGGQVVLGEPIDLAQVTTDAYVVAGLTDHLTRWQSCYSTTQLLGSQVRFVLVMGGHIQSIIRPPGGRSAGFRTAARTPRDPERWLERTKGFDESWWNHWIDWLGRRSRGMCPAPATLGSTRYPPIEDAPGSYVRRRLDAA
jgi:polyhydroxyalkanoate synthase